MSHAAALIQHGAHNSKQCRGNLVIHVANCGIPLETRKAVYAQYDWEVESIEVQAGALS